MQTFNLSDISELEAHGITLENAESQMARFKEGFPYLTIKSAATISNNGIKKLTSDEAKELVNIWEEYTSENHDIVKFVPASGAATRMFKDLYEYINGNHKELNKATVTLLDRIRQFAFFEELNQSCLHKHSKSIERLIEEKEFSTIVENLLNPDALGYGQKPKGALLFHKYKNFNRTAFEEHLAEASQYASSNGKAKIHFTVSEDHQDLFEELKARCEKQYTEKYNLQYEITFSNQKKSTDTLAADINNQPFRENGQLTFRPSGHGALIENLNDIDADVIFIKNIDNISIEDKYPDAVSYKKILAGMLIRIQKQIAEWLKELPYSSEKQLDCIATEADHIFCTNIKEKTQGLNLNDKREYLNRKLNRPIRVCGMIRNSGEPGGGPYIISNAGGETSLQILESSQIDTSREEEMQKMKESSHFNPVDLVCYTKDVNGNKFDLTKYVDSQTGFISEKSKNGIALKALERPGLWNGAMADWNTVFVEVPMDTFNPVKTVIDLLREGHQL